MSALCYPDGDPESATSPDCPGQTIELTDTTSTGSITLSSDGSYQMDMSTTLRYDVVTPLSCIGGTDAGCEATESYLHGIGYAGECAVVGENCACDMSITGGDPEQGTYAANGDQITFTDSNGSSRTGGYCVDGNQLGYFWSDVDDLGNEYQTNMVLTKG